MAAIYFGVRLLGKICENWDSVVDTVVTTSRLAWETVRDWLAAKRVDSVDVGSLVQTRLANGNYRVVTGLFSQSGELREKTAWECGTLDSELTRRFSGKDRIRVQF
ncbi:hypothetical protein [Geomonas limicola]|nr:hypothetical protein [Geomonas limicola]